MRPSIRALLVTLLGATPSALADIQEYQIRRLVAMRTDCQVASVTSSGDESAHPRFLVTCVDSTDYPDGLVVDCSNDIDDRSCVIGTEARSFDLLHQLQTDE